MNSTVYPPSHDQAASLLQYARGKTRVRDRQIVTLLLHTGIKIGELVSLDVGDVYTGNRIRKSVRIAWRGGKSARAVPLDRISREAIALILEFNLNRGASLDPDQPLVISRQRNQKDASFRITSRQVQRIVRSLADEADLGFKVTPSTIRHTFAKTQLDGGADLPTVQHLLGHRDLKTTRDYYALPDREPSLLALPGGYRLADLSAEDY
jgi:integrase/recombinase XerD